MKKIKLLLVLGISLLAFSPMIINANDDTEENLVCYYRENCQGELEYVCVDPTEPQPCQLICPPGCQEED